MHLEKACGGRYNPVPGGTDPEACLICPGGYYCPGRSKAGYAGLHGAWFEGIPYESYANYTDEKSRKHHGA